MRIKPLGKVVIVIVVLGLGVGAYRLWARGGSGFVAAIAPSAKEGESVVPGKINLPESSSTAGGSSGSVTLPGTGAGCTDKPEVRMLGYAWNAQMGLHFAKGGARNPSKGAHFMTMMGDGSAAFLKGLNDTLKRLGPEYTAKIVGCAGYSRGEDKFMG